MPELLNSPANASLSSMRSRLGRVFRPESVAVVGLSDNSIFSHLFSPDSTPGMAWHFVNPRHESVLNHPTVPRLSDVDTPISVVMSLLPAQASTELVEEAADLDVAGMILVASGFAEAGHDGAVLQQRIARAARRAGMPLIGPNGLGFVNARHRVMLTIAGHHHRRPGGLSIVSQSGATLSAATMAAWEYAGCGLNLTISAGNEAATDIADYVDYLAFDDDTTAIGVILEEIRRPAEFFAAAARAIARDKPVVALKLGRTRRASQMAASHTGAVAGESWVYDIALRQAGIALASDPEELIDRLALFDQIPAARRTEVRSAGVVTLTGGMASLSLDLAAEEGLVIPPLPSFQGWIDTTFKPGFPANPLDAGARGLKLWPEIVDRYVSSPALDAVLVINPLAEGDEITNAQIITGFNASAAGASKPLVLANLSGVPAPWARSLMCDRIACGRGLRGSLRGLRTIGAFTRYRERPPDEPAPVDPLPPPAVLAGPAGSAMVPFAAAMSLLAGRGIPVAPYVLIDATSEVSAASIPFEPPWAVKLANVAHRTEIGGVRTDVGIDDLPLAMAGLREVARTAGCSVEIAIQPMLAPFGELFVGVHGQTSLGPAIVVGPGGVALELLPAPAGRMAPITRAQADDLIAEIQLGEIMRGFRGRPAWDLVSLADILVRVAQLGADGSGWIESLDINPLIFGPAGFHVVDAVLFPRTRQQREARWEAI
jgi:acetate---CoA ligase (ADP-forming)